MFSKTKDKNSITRSKAIQYLYNLDPNPYAHCRDFLSNVTKFLNLKHACETNDHYVGINQTDGKLYEIFSYVVGFEGTNKFSGCVRDFVKPPRPISVDDFLDLADSAYPGIRTLYEGMQENNLYMYQDLLEHSAFRYGTEYWKPVDLSERKLVFKYNTEHAIRHNRSQNSEIYPLVVISEFLLEKGFVFQEALVGGGIDEVSHTGTKAYHARYTRFETFRDECEKDIALAAEKIEKEYHSWATIDYRFILVQFKRSETEVIVEIGESKSMLWKHITDIDASVIEEANQKLLQVYGEGTKTKQRYYI